jgi:hypothetical protein
MENSQGDGPPELEYREHAHDENDKFTIQLEIIQKIHKIIQHLSLLYRIKKECQSGFSAIYVRGRNNYSIGEHEDKTHMSDWLCKN